MTRARDIIVRTATLAGMAVAVVGLMKLTGADVSVSQKTSATIAGAAAHETAAGEYAPVSTRAERLAVMAASWSGDIAFGPTYAALTPLSADEGAATDHRFDPADEYWGLPRSNGVETVSAYCSACHSLALVMQQSQDEAGWNYLLTWMVEKQGMAPPDPQTRDEILAYLTREFGRE